MRKLIILFSLMLVALTSSLRVDAATWHYKWINTVIDIPLGSELEGFKYLPKAYLYKDDTLLEDANITYLRDGDWMFFLKDVDTNKAGSYKVWYKAFEYDKYKPGTCNDYKCLITFNVIDDVPPSIVIGSDEIYRNRGYLAGASQEEINKDLMNNITIHENSDDYEVKLTHSINYNYVGDYEVLVSVSDKSGNIATGGFLVRVGESFPPELLFLGEGSTLLIPLNSKIDIKKYFKAVDRISGDISDHIIFPPIDTSKIQEFEYSPYVINDGLKTSCTILIKVVDDVPPKIILKNNAVIFDYLTDFTSFDFTSLIQSVEDNLEYNPDNMKITNNIENKVGGYQVVFTYTDGTTEVSETLAVTLVSKVSPVIECPTITLSPGSIVDLSDFVKIIDPSDDNVIKSLIIDDKMVDYNKPGSYYASAYCINSSGLEGRAQINVIIENSASSSLRDSRDYIIIGLIGAISLGAIIFIVYYFVIRKKHKAI